MHDHYEASLGFPAGGHDEACRLMHVLSVFLPINQCNHTMMGPLISIPNPLPLGQLEDLIDSCGYRWNVTYLSILLLFNHCARARLVLEILHIECRTLVRELANQLWGYY